MDRQPVVTTPLDAMDPYAREAQTNPTLTADQVHRVEAFGVVERIPRGAQLFKRGDRSVDFFLVLDGRVDVLDVDACGRETLLMIQGPAQFTGETDLFNDHQILVNAEAAADSQIVRVKHDVFRRLLTAEPDIGEIVMRAFILRRIALIRHAQGGVVLLGAARAADTQRLQRFLMRNSYPHRVLDVDGDASCFMQGFSLTRGDLPVVVDVGGRLLKNPTNPELADALGLTETIPPNHVYDVAVIGAGPAGLAAAVYAASEGLDTIVVEGTAPGGQAGQSSKIENYLGFPTGISGQALAARAQVQAQKFGARLAISRDVVSIDCSGQHFRLTLDGGQSIAARSVVVATGARYRTLDLPNYARFEGQGIYYAATAMESELCKGEQVVVVGAGNSAGQAAVFLARNVDHVHMLCRGPGLAATMSSYLVERIEASPRITLHTRTEITALEGDRSLERVTWRNAVTGQSETHAISNVFAMIGATPRTEWLGGCLELDAKGFVVTGRPAADRPLASPFETTRPGIFAVGDVRSGSVKRVASGVGEGAVVVHAIHHFLNPALHATMQATASRSTRS